jgi:hypothetical protein
MFTDMFKPRVEEKNENEIKSLNKGGSPTLFASSTLSLNLK